MADTPIWTEARKRSVDNLQRFYAVMITLAATELLKRVFYQVADGVHTPTSIEVCQLVGFFATIVPFYHGAIRYLDATYITGEREAKDHALMFDFVSLFLQGVGFFILAVYFRTIQVFYFVAILILLWDVIWVGITQLTTKSLVSDEKSGFAKWMTVNLISIFVIGICLSTAFIKEELRFYIIPMMLVLRTIADYSVTWSFYFPPKSDVAI